MRELQFAPPTRPWSTNDERRWHWARRARTVKAWRETAGWAARAAGCRDVGPAEVRITIPFSRNCRRDPMNYIGTIVKATIDGLVDAGCWPDDTAEWVEIRQPLLVVGGPVIVATMPRL